MTTPINIENGLQIAGEFIYGSDLVWIGYSVPEEELDDVFYKAHWDNVTHTNNHYTVYNTRTRKLREL